jgi:ketohexokinase
VHHDYHRLTMPMARILGVGIAALDIINEVQGYPGEDQEVRAWGQRVTAGGNAANTLTVLSLLGQHCELAATLADDPAAALLRADLAARGVGTGACRVVVGGCTPTSCVVLNRLSATRTIVHHRDLPEFGFDDFARIELAGYDWLHLEGRNVTETRRMLDHVARARRELPVSLEIEKPRPGIEALYLGPGLLLFSRHYARACGFHDPLEFLRHVARIAPRAALVCAWGAQGAWARAPDGAESHAGAVVPPRLVDTLGAGDTFNAGVIAARLAGAGLDDALTRACALAGSKCGMMGFDGLGASRT